MKTGTGDIFLEKLKKEIDDNLTNDQFSVEELARNVGMSRSQLHRKLNSATGQSVSQFIREHRLKLGMALLKGGDLTAAEVADRVGFGSATYFNKCFNEYYGFPPGEVKNKIAGNIPFVEQGPENAPPNVTRSKRPLLLTIIGACILLFVVAYPLTRQTKVDIERQGKSIAILPFKNLSADQSNEYFSEGVIEAIRTNLSQIGELRVISRTSVEKYKNTEKSAREIAEQLGVAALLEGSIQRDNNAIRIEVRMIDGLSEEQAWATTYDRELKDVFAIQTEIAEHVAKELQTKLSAEERSKLSRVDTENPRAYDLYLKGLYEYRTYTNQGTHNAIDLLSEAIALDSNYARAYAYLAYSHISLAAIFGAELSALEGLNKGKPFIDKALAIDPELDIAHMLLGFYYLYHDWNLEGAESEYKKAVVADDPDALSMYGDLLNFVQRHEEAMSLAERLNTTEPYYPNSRMILAYVYNRRFDEALEFSESRLKLFNNYYTLESHGFLLLQVGRYKEAVTYFNKGFAIEGIRYPRMLGWMGAAYARAGDKENALKIIEELKERLSKGEKGSIAFFISVVYAALDDKANAIKWIQTAYQSHDMEMPWIMTEPQFTSLLDTPEFRKISREMGFK
ncbi:MAG: helix-turn-helix domain-containing protein [Bacteroidota bacterium]